MPRGKRKRGAFDCHIWFADGCRYRLTSLPDQMHTDVDILNSIRSNLLPMLEAAAKAEKKKADEAG